MLNSTVQPQAVHYIFKNAAACRAHAHTLQATHNTRHLFVLRQAERNAVARCLPIWRVKVQARMWASYRSMSSYQSTHTVWRFLDA